MGCRMQTAESMLGDGMQKAGRRGGRREEVGGRSCEVPGEKWKAEAGGEWWEASGRVGSRRQVEVKSCKQKVDNRGEAEDRRVPVGRQEVGDRR